MEHCAIQVLHDNFTHIFYNTKYAILFDPSEPEIILQALTKNLLPRIYQKSEIPDLEDLHSPRKILYSFTTHHHADHSQGNDTIIKHCSNVLIGSCEREYAISSTGYFYSGIMQLSMLKELGMSIEAIHTPCHTRDSYCFYITINCDGVLEDKKYLITGDTIFYLGVGKFFEGCGQEMVQNLNYIKSCDPQSIVLYGHDYRKRNLEFVERFWSIPGELKEKTFLSLGEELEYNPFFNLDGVGKEGNEVEIMTWLRAEKDKM